MAAGATQAAASGAITNAASTMGNATASGLALIIPWIGFFLIIWIAFESVGLIGAMFGSGSSHEHEEAHSGAKGFFENRKKKKEEKEKHDEERAPHLRNIEHYVEGVRNVHLVRLSKDLKELETALADVKSDIKNPGKWKRVRDLGLSVTSLAHSLRGDFGAINSHVDNIDSRKARIIIKQGLVSSELLHESAKDIPPRLTAVGNVLAVAPPDESKLHTHLVYIESDFSKACKAYRKIKLELHELEAAIDHEVKSIH